jgi:tRNA modification GTPase
MTDSLSQSCTSSSRNTAAVLTARGRGAVATIRINGQSELIDVGSQPLFQSLNGKPVASQLVGRMIYGHWGKDVREDVVVCRVSDDELEIHCHGGDTAVQRILVDLRSVGFSVQSWQAMLTESTSLLATECAEVCSRARTVRTADLLWEQQSGVLREGIEDLIRLTQTCLESETATKEMLALTIGLVEMLHWSEFGRHLSEPWQVVLVGQPNVGKSSLINALVGFSRSIVFDQPGTTRDVVTVETAFEGWPIQLADTAGMRESEDELELAGMCRARESLAIADCRVLLLDVSCPHNNEDDQLLSEWPSAIVVAHKSDLSNHRGQSLTAETIAVSSVTGDGVDQLFEAIIQRLIPKLPSPGLPIPVCVRQGDLLSRASEALDARNLPVVLSLLEELTA